MAKVTRVIFELANGSRLQARVRDAAFSNPGTIAPMYEGFTTRMAATGVWDVQFLIEDCELQETDQAVRDDSLYGSLFTPKIKTDGMAAMERRANLRAKGLDPDEDRAVNTKRFSAIEIDED